MAKAILFDRYDSRLAGSHSYTFWTTGYSVYYDGKAVELRHYNGSYDGPGVSLIDNFDPQTIVCGEEIDVEKFPEAVHRELGVTAKVPNGCILVVQRDRGGKSHECYGRFEVHLGGTEVTPAELKKHTLLHEGQETVGEEYSPTRRVKRTKIRNRNGQAVYSDGDAADKAAFAREQVKLLEERLGCGQDVAWRIAKAGGPGRVRNALSWVDALIARLTQAGGSRAYAARCIANLLKGVGDDRGALTDIKSALGITDRLGRDAFNLLRGGTYIVFGRERYLKALEELGLPAPEEKSTARTLSSTIAIARAMIEEGFLPRTQTA